MATALTGWPETDARVLASGKVALIFKGKVFWTGDAEDASEAHYYYHPEDGEAYAVYCSICDGAGHGQPGYAPCPIEDGGRYEYEPEGPF
jgi:hypothetical protein